jgi:hypothetical protein
MESHWDIGTDITGHPLPLMIDHMFQRHCSEYRAQSPNAKPESVYLFKANGSANVTDTAMPFLDSACSGSVLVYLAFEAESEIRDSR